MDNLGSTRQQILALLKKRGPQTVEQLSEALGISPMGVRQHLTQLERQGLVATEKRRGGMGRPAHVYSLTAAGDELFPRHYDGFAVTILDCLREIDGAEKVDQVFHKRMERLLATYAKNVDDRALPERLVQLAHVQEQNGYMVDFGPRPEGGYYFVEHNCVLARVARLFPTACRYELKLFETLLGAPVRREQCIAQGDNCCAYVIDEPQGDPLPAQATNRN